MGYYVEIFLVFVLFFLLGNYLNRKWKMKLNIPAGPSGLPIIGNLHQVLVRPYHQFSKWAYKYGKCYSINVFGTPALVINDAQTMRQVLGTIESTGRFLTETFKETAKGNNGVILAEGKAWTEQRAFVLNAMKECGFGRSSVIEPIIHRETDDVLLEWFKNEGKENGVIVSLRPMLIQALGKIIWNILTRDKAQNCQTKIGKLVDKWSEMLQITTNSGLMFLSWLKHIIPEWSGYNGLHKVCKELDAEVNRHFESHKKKQKGNSDTRDIFDIYLDQMKTKCQDVQSSFYGDTGWLHSFYSVEGLLIAGGETTAITINWMINYLAVNPEVQTKLQEQVDSVLGDKAPSLKDKPKLPYLEAVILETLRLSSLVPFGMIHKLLANVEFHGYQLPKGMLLIANIFHANTDQTVWQDPEKFRPERFLKGDELQRKKLKDTVATFQQGKRICPGEHFAKDVLFLIAAKVFRNFEFRKMSHVKEDEYMEPEAGYLLLPPQRGVMVKRRNFISKNIRIKHTL